VRNVSIVVLGKYSVTATINDLNEIEFVKTHVANPMLGDMVYEVRYGPYKQFGTVKFPSLIHHHQGDGRLNPGHSALEVEVSAVKANASIQILAPPDSAKVPLAPITRIESKKLAEGVWYIGGITHGSVAVEFRDFVTVIEAPLNERRAIAVIKEVRRLFPGKAIRFLVNTHHHFDHAGGMRTFVAEGATVVTHHLNRDFYEKLIFSRAPRTLEQDRLSLVGVSQFPVPLLEPVNDKYDISDGARTLVIYALPAFDHAATMVVAYLPREQMMINADTYAPPEKGAPLPKATESTRALRETIERFHLNVTRHVGLHGGIGTHQDFLRTDGQAAAN